MINIPRRRVLSAAAMSLALPTLPMRAMASTEPPLRVIVPIPAGGGSDVIARALAREMERLGGRPVIVENVPGGGGVIAAQTVLNRPADGNSVLFGTASGIVAGPATSKSPRFNPLTDFAPVNIVNRTYWQIYVASNSPYATLQDLVEAAKRNPGRISTGDATVGYQLAMALFAKNAGIKLNQVPYKGVGQAYQDLIGGNIDLMIGELGIAQPLIQSGKIRPVARFVDQKSPVLTNVPTLRQLGYGEIPLFSWAGFFVKAGTPADTVSRLTALTADAARSKGYADFTARGFSEAVAIPPEECTPLLRQQLDVHRQAMVIAGVEPQ